LPEICPLKGPLKRLIISLEQCSIDKSQGAVHVYTKFHKSLNARQALSFVEFL
jgi:hypothetical protein